MTISITSPTSTTSKIQQNGNDVLTVDSSNNVTVINNLSVSGTVSSTGAITFDGGVSGNVNFDSGTLYVDATNNRVGIGTSSPSYKLQVYGASNPEMRLGDAVVTYQLYTEGATAAVMGTVGSHALVYRTNATERTRITSAGEFLVGTTTNNIGYTCKAAIDSVGGNTEALGTKRDSTGASGHIGFFNPNGRVGEIYTNGTATVYATSSDYRLKENNVNITDGIERVKLLKPYRFNFIADDSVTVDGFFAHEVQNIVPEAISGTKDEVDDEGNPVYQGIDQSKLVPLLTAALQEAITKIEDLETRIQALENK